MKTLEGNKHLSMSYLLAAAMIEYRRLSGVDLADLIHSEIVIALGSPLT